MDAGWQDENSKYNIIINLYNHPHSQSQNEMCFSVNQILSNDAIACFN